MIYTKKRVTQELETILNKEYDIIQIATFAEKIYANHCRELEGDLDDVIMVLSSMEHGPEFEYSESELKFLVKLLVLDEPNPIEKLKGRF